MAETIVEDPVRPTLVEEAPRPTLPEDEPPPPPRKPPSTGRLVAIALLVFALVLAGGGVALYFFVLRAEPVALRHVPSNASVVARADLVALASYPPVRKHLIERASTPSAASTPTKPMAERIERATGFNPMRDPRELALASVDGVTWVAIVSGKIPRGRFVKGLEALAREEHWQGARLEDGLLYAASLVFAQADDGSIIIGNDRAIVMAALPVADEVTHELPVGPVAISIRHQAWDGAAGSNLALASLSRVDHAEGSIALKDAPELSLHVHPAQSLTPAAIAQDLTAMLDQLRLVTALAPDLNGSKAALASVKVTPGADDVLVTATWPRDGLEGALDKLF